MAHLAQKVERWPFKPMVVGSIPTVGAHRIVNNFFYSIRFTHAACIITKKLIVAFCGIRTHASEDTAT